MPNAEPNRRQLRQIMAASAIASILVLSGVAGLLSYATALIDDHQLAMETRLVRQRLAVAKALMRENVVSASVWNDAVLAVERRDWGWAQVNFGDYYADYLDHDVTLLFDAEGRLAYASRQSERQPLDREQGLANAVLPIVAEVRAQGRLRRGAEGKPAIAGLSAVVTREATLAVAGEVYLICVSSVVAEDLAHATGHPNDPVVVSARKVEQLVSGLDREILLERPQLSPPGAGAPAVDLADPDGRAIASVTWTPRKPGQSAREKVAPYVLAGAALLILALVVAFLRISQLLRNLERNEAARTAALHAAQDALAAKSRFLANISHELRTPLNGVVAVAKLLRASVSVPSERAMADLIVTSGKVLEHMVDDVLDVAKIEAGGLKLEISPLRLSTLLGSVAMMQAPAANAKGVALSWEVRMTDDGFLGDQIRLTQILSNLVANAVKFTETGKIIVRAKQVGPDVQILVADTGIGFARDQLTRLFRPFEQADASTTRRFGGTGLGLAICGALVSQMGGAITARSAPGRGAVFRVRLPLARCSLASASQDAGGESTPEPPARRLKVLLAEDHPINQQIVAMILEPLGCDLTIVEDGRQAVEAWREEPFDLVLMDLQMPVMDGLTAIGEIRAAEARAGAARTPVFCLTANVEATAIAACSQAGADQHLAKPLDPARLIELISDLAARDPQPTS